MHLLVGGAILLQLACEAVFLLRGIIYDFNWEGGARTKVRLLLDLDSRVRTSRKWTLGERICLLVLVVLIELIHSGVVAFRLVVVNRVLIFLLLRPIVDVRCL